MTDTNTALAIMFADIAQSTKLYDKIGNTAAHALISSCIAVMSEVCASHGGTIVKTIGDEIMCTFPTTKDAVDAAMRMQAALDKIPEADLAGYYSPDIYVGIDYGPVIQENADVFGDAVNVAARMVKMAKRRQIVTTRQVIDTLPQDYAEYCRCIDNVLVKGKSEELAVYEIVWEKEKITVALKSSGEGRSLIRHRLKLQFGDKTFEVSDSRPAVSIGRLDHNDVVVNDNRVSRFHARIEYRKDKYFIIDQSTNGTYVTEDGADTVLVLRDELQLGNSGMLDLCNEKTSRSSPTMILYTISYYKASEPEATAKSVE
ncbi:MAG: adenylate/guanylate cyclase [uncultured bacterium]|nr:MAG: adenylate/guanylate cyclase [uncultured bacterium]